MPDARPIPRTERKRRAGNSNSAATALVAVAVSAERIPKPRGPDHRPDMRIAPGNNFERRSSHLLMDPSADVETTSTSAMPMLLTPVRVGVAGAQTGDAYGRFAAEVHGFLVRTVRDGDVAADLLADAFTKLLVEEREGRWPDRPRAWLYRVASNLAMSRGRRLRVAARVDQVLQARHHDQVSDSPDAEVLRRERRSDLDRALGLLGTDARVALILAAQGFDGTTIAMTIGRTEAATRTLMCRSRMRLREALREGDR
jgi:RNA polymerase sigma-70 factor, ECF subfamily